MNRDSSACKLNIRSSILDMAVTCVLITCHTGSDHYTMRPRDSASQLRRKLPPRPLFAFQAWCNLNFPCCLIKVRMFSDMECSGTALLFYILGSDLMHLFTQFPQVNILSGNNALKMSQEELLHSWEYKQITTSSGQK
jgi:hypothetical protein